MNRKIYFFLIFSIPFLRSSAQDNAAYLKEHAIRIDNPEKLNDDVYKLLIHYKVIMLGEMHGTNESAQLVKGLANMFTDKGDSVQVGLEIPERLMNQFLNQGTDSSIYQSAFFQNPTSLSGRESVAWADLIATLHKNPMIQLFFYDVNPNEGKAVERDSLMYVKIKTQFLLHPDWKMVTLSGNFHNRITDRTTMAYYLKMDRELILYSRICSLNIEYLEGICNANFGHGLEVKHLGHEESVYDTTFSFDKYIVLFSAKSNYPYNGFYYTKHITAAKMTEHK